MGFFQNTCKPEGFGGKIMVTTMNGGYAALAKWGLSHLAPRSDWSVLEIGCGRTGLDADYKTLAAQLYGEMKEFFPENAVEYFVYYYDSRF